MGECADRYVELVRAKTLTGALSMSTAEVYARDVATFVQLVGEEVVLDDLTGEEVDAVLLAFARKPDGRRRSQPEARSGALQSASSQARFRRSVSALFKHAVLVGWVQINPMATATVTARERGGLRPERRALTREQAQGLIGAARDLSGGPGEVAGAGRARRRDQRTELRDGLIVLMLSTMGPRVSELVRANVEDFYTNDGVRYWRIFGKGGKTRDVPLPGDVALVLEAYLARGRMVSADKALLLSWRGRRLARGDVQAVIDRVQRGVDPDRRRSVTPHGLRHTTATHLLADAVDMDAVRRVLGHSDLATLGRYRDELPGELEVAMRSHPLLRGPVSG
ncbi:tyrosine-type recombinase/integrase [Streptosporangium sp. NBC_01755]|uniref:tyrosine-type recombinase/integrase n=1 Tax=unclassified Streptosporangium TaxID=2632669 RepID=UPI002DD9799C|nr:MULTISPECIES: tyrosine-type recombinase/integrase [unclassified Streptosporangium]WSA28522.1 tyrosine-type recombinase/integrase [Streptosporangium sp. NBC_01810]WSC99989.1 tyrosine-type recombinase/integrase [Streptosporangium sp. NBC_01755]